VTVNVAGADVAVPAGLVKTAASFSKLCCPVATNEYVVVVAPGNDCHVVPSSVEYSHCTLGVGVPVAAAENDTSAPEATVWPVGCAEMAGATSTVRAAEVEVAVPATLVNTASYWSPLSPSEAAKEYVVEVAPAMGAQDDPLAEANHCTLGAGDPEAATVNEAVAPAATVPDAGWVTMTGAIGAGTTVSVATCVRV
jgi:hypothetical protein